ncbi:gamma-glutamylcysteine synthetase [Streptococcus ratti]|uniref:glutamate--cysteine ligase n=1 Tax=Streptococcus ratti TaxID=1341 RepID=A0A7X9LEE9_STRRT|nr:gamma-glutamylcysteine synthetase [Streptococcus ratti]NMD49666.1 gamma-glutamylcysteine synthetase [Streptococcus ratti]
MTKAIDLLKRRYLDNIKESPEAYIGVELEFPIVNLKQEATDLRVTKALLSYLPQVLPFEVEKCDTDGQPVQLVNKSTEDRILFEVSYNTIEFALGKVKKIQDAEKRFNHYLEAVQDFLDQYNHAIQGFGVHPYWNLNDNSAVKLPRYQMLLDFLALSKNKKDPFFHKFPQYGSFICGNQVQLDVSKDNYLRVINAFNKIEAAKAYLFANSEFWGQNWPFKISRDIFWENSMHGVFKENVGVNSRSFKTEEDFFDYLAGSALFTAERNGEVYYFEPIRARDYLLQKDISAWNLKGEKVTLLPQETDFDSHRSYQYQNLTKRGTVEFRSVCTQPLDQTFAPVAFHVGLLANLDNLEKFLQTSDFLSVYHHDYKGLRRRFSQKKEKTEDREKIKKFTESLLNCSLEGLRRRGNGEAKYLSDKKGKKRC